MVLKAETVNYRFGESAIYKRVTARDSGNLRNLNICDHISHFVTCHSLWFRDPVSSTGKSPFVAFGVIFLEPCKKSF